MTIKTLAKAAVKPLMMVKVIKVAQTEEQAALFGVLPEGRAEQARVLGDVGEVVAMRLEIVGLKFRRTDDCGEGAFHQDCDRNLSSLSASLPLILLLLLLLLLVQLSVLLKRLLRLLEVLL